MAAIDKTYVYNYEDFVTLTNWAKKAEFTNPDGTVTKMKYALINPDLSKEEFKELLEQNGKDWGVPVMNTNHVEDYWLIKSCPTDFVQNRMKHVYNKEYINEILTGKSEYDKPRENGGKHCRIVKRCASKKNYFDKISNVGTDPLYIDIKLPEDRYGEICFVKYVEDENRWILPGELTDTESNCSSCAVIRFKTIKALVRNILKWNLPVGTIIKVEGRYSYDSDYTLEILA